MAEAPNKPDPIAQLLDERVTDAAEIRWQQAKSEARRLRRWAAVAGGVLAALSVLPLSLSPLSAIIAGTVALCLVPVGILTTANIRQQLNDIQKLGKALEQVLWRSERVRALQRAGQPLTDAQRIEAAERTRKELLDKFRRSKLYAYQSSFDFVSELPLPPTQEIEVRRRIVAGQSAAAVFRIVGPAWLAVGLVIVWTSIFLVIWGLDPTTCQLGAAECVGAFQGLSTHPTPGDFIYLTLNAAVANMPPDIIARSRVAHMAFAATFTSGALLIASYATLLWRSVDSQIAAARVSLGRNSDADGLDSGGS
jgi:hypothetical protein